MKNNSLAKFLLDWYTLHGRDLPWRVKGGAHPDPYVVLVSEIMLQQTTVKTVLGYFPRFMARFPSVADLAAADIDEVYRYWQGLGYYSRARSLHAAAQTIMHDYGGIFPRDKKQIAGLKGLGDYTIASFLALAFNQPETVVDGNVIRIISRLYYLTHPIDEIMPLIRDKAAALTDKNNAADYASAIMDLGALICTPKNPQCLLCPWQNFCLCSGQGDVEQIPQRRRIEKKTMCTNVYVIANAKGEVFIRKRTEKGLLSGLYEFPWGEEWHFSDAADSNLSVTHVFTHIKLTLRIFTRHTENVPTDGCFVKISDLPNYALSTLMKKVAGKVLQQFRNNS